jgi:hypothetical protein
VSSGSEKPGEFRRYRQALAVLYVGTIAAGFALLGASVARQLLWSPDVEFEGPMLEEDNPDPRLLLECNRRVRKLYDQLDQETLELLGSPPRGEDRELRREWEAFGRDWIQEWHRVNAQCRFEDLADSMGDAFERLAEVHGDLRAMRLKYQSILVRFDKEQAAELLDMKRALDDSRRAFEALLPQD